ncbi:MAG: Xaa-Pro peptidase family protein [Gemmatimonadota bacterium]
MPTRRDFLSASATLAVVGVRKRPDDSVPEQNPAPASIAALKSMKDQMRPITGDERRLRIEKARRLMTEKKSDALFLAGGTSLKYFTNVDWGTSERMFAVVIPRTGRSFVVCPYFERDRAMEQINSGPLAKDADIMTWNEDESPSRLVAEGLKARGIATGQIAVEETVRFVFSDGVGQAAPGMKVVSGTSITAGCRMVKSKAELDLMRLAAAVTLKAYEAAYRALKPGLNQNDFAGLVRQAHEKLGFAGGAGVQVGEYSALPHGSITPQVIKEGTILLIDGGCKVDGYESDISRTFVLGKPTDKMKKVFDIELRAQTAAVKTARPGLPCEAVDAAARKVIVDAGYGPDYKYFTHRVGHGMGMDGHEWPYLVRGNKLPLQAGMTFSDEPGIYIPGEFGIRLEDDMIITENGAELMTPQSPSLEDPFGRVAS